MLYFVLFLFLIIYGCNDKSINTCEKFEKLMITQSNLIDTSKLLLAVNELLENEPKCIDALLTRADLLMSLNDVNSAREDYMKVLDISPSNIYALYRMGILNELKQNNDSAAYYFRFALKEKEKNGGFIDYTNKLKGIENPKSKYDISAIELIYQNGIVSYYLRDMNMALKNFELCISESYNLNQVYLYRGAVFLETGNLDSACEDFHNAVELGNQDALKYSSQYCK